MPVFEYKCRQCGNQFEYLLRHNSAPAECPECHQRDLEQLLSLCAVSSEASRQASLQAAHARAAGVRHDRQHQEHAHLHEHFEDSSSNRGPAGSKSD